MFSAKFSEDLIDMILEGEKDTTWRIWDDRDVSVDQEISLEDTDGRRFAEARVRRVKETTFGRLSEEDREGHESFDSEREMYRTYRRYYGIDVGPDTRVKVIKFELLD